MKILTHIVNDMLDYAQLSAGQFRKLYSKFNVRNSINEIIDVMAFKAKELGITLHTKYEVSGTVVDDDDMEIVVNFDKQRLQ